MAKRVLVIDDVQAMRELSRHASRCTSAELGGIDVPVTTALCDVLLRDALSTVAF